MAYTNDVPSHFIFNILDEYEIHIMSCSVRGSSRTQRTLSQQQPFILFPFHIIHLYNILFRSLPLSLCLSVSSSLSFFLCMFRSLYIYLFFLDVAAVVLPSNASYILYCFEFY